MGISCITRNTYSIFPLLLLLLILIIIPSSSSFAPTDFVTKEIINKLCPQSTVMGGGFCAKWLNSDPRTTSMNIHGLIELTAIKAQEFGFKNLALMNDLARSSGNDKQLKKAYKTCANSYVIAIEELEMARLFLSHSSFPLALYAASKALGYAYECKDQFDGPSSEPPLVLDRNKKFITMCYIAMDFASLFIS